MRLSVLRIYTDDPMQEPPNTDKGRPALGRLLNSHGERLYATMRRLTLRGDVATELFQELFLRLGRSAGFEGADDPAAYAFRTAINLAMEWRRRRASDRVTAVLAGEPESRELPPLQGMMRAEQHQQLLDAMSELADPPRELLVLRFIEEESYAAIAGRLGKTAHQARGLCHAAVRQLRLKLVEGEARCKAGSLEDDHV